MATKGEKTKQLVLETTAELFWRNSYHGININTICKVAGINKATLYQYYPSKEELALATIEYHFERTRNFIFESSFNAHREPLQRLEGIYKRVYASAKRSHETDNCCPGCPIGNIGLELATQNIRIREATHGVFVRFEKYYRSIIRDAKKLKQARRPLSEVKAVNALISNMHGALAMSKLQNRPEAIMDAFQTAKRIVFD